MKNAKALAMLQLNVVHLDKIKILIIINLWIIHDNFEKNIVAKSVKFYYKRPTDRLAIFVRLGYVILRGMKIFERF